jgi:guanine deaminase
VIDTEATHIINYRREKVSDIFELLFFLMRVGSEININATHIDGETALVGE